jgi:hypothetical protein
VQRSGPDIGINLQPNAVRELYELAIGPDQLGAIGLQTREFVLVGLNGKEVYAEPRGLRAGYKWPQYSVHRFEYREREYVADMAQPIA